MSAKLSFVMSKTNASSVVHVSPRGGLTLPAEIRRASGVHAGDTLVVSVEDGRIVLQPAVVVPVERYTDERIREFEKSAAMTDKELAKAKRKWGA
jgi:AbrB family looped-hinge helix DNA binding protein